MMSRMSNRDDMSRSGVSKETTNSENPSPRHCIQEIKIAYGAGSNLYFPLQQQHSICFASEPSVQCKPGFATYQPSAFGFVSASVYNGTTFYHYHNDKVFNLQNNTSQHLGQQNNFQVKEHVGKDKEKSKHQRSPSNHVTMNETIESGCSSFTSISSASSRCSSPFPLSTHSSARDSGLASTESTDDDSSLFDPQKTNELRKGNLIQVIRKAAEEILSDENLSKDSYLFRQMKRNAEGFVSIRLLACAKTIKKLIKSDVTLLIAALKSSSKLLVNTPGTKVKRVFPLPDHMVKHKKPSSLIIINPKTISEIEDATKRLKIFGEISQVRMIRPGKSMPCYLKSYSQIISQAEKVLCVVVEFESEASVFAAYKSLISEKSADRVAILGPKVKISQETDSKDYFSCDKLKNEFKDQNSEDIIHRKPVVSRINSGESSHSGDSGIFSNQINNKNSRKSVKSTFTTRSMSSKA